MTALATVTRQGLANLLQATHRTVHEVTPRVPVPPCLVVQPDVGWITPSRLGSLDRFELRLKILIVERDNADGLAGIEDAVEEIFEVIATTCQVNEITPPMPLDVGAQGTVLVSEIKLSIQVKE